jgi:hypothetical protein
MRTCPSRLCRARRLAPVLLTVLLVGGCGGTEADSRDVPPTVTANPTTQPGGMPQDSVSSTTEPVLTTPPSTANSTTGLTTTTSPTTTLVPTTTVPTTTPYVVPVVDVAAAGWGTTHSAYPATDVFLACGSALVSPVNGTLLEVRRVDAWSASVDNPATRGGRSISIRGDDGVRYYMAHFDTIGDALEPGERVTAGQPLGTMGTTGRSSACHLHFGISPECPGKEWSVRRGAVWPYLYLDAWRRGEQLSPVDEVTAWSAANPDACALAMLDPFAIDS